MSGWKNGPAAIPSEGRLRALWRLAGWDDLVALIDRARGITRQRELESRLRHAQAEIERLRTQVAWLSRPPAQFARMRMRDDAVARLARLRRARRLAREDNYARR